MSTITSGLQEEKEERDYWSLLQSSQAKFYPDFVETLSSHRGAFVEGGRAAVIEFHSNAKPSVQNFQTPANLREYIDKTPSKTPHQRAFVLEGLPKNFIIVLGTKLRVPPSFFAEHWPNPGQVGNLVNCNPRHYDNQERCTLKFERLHEQRNRTADGSNWLKWRFCTDSDVYREIDSTTVFGDEEDPFYPLHTSERFSFWSVRAGETWDGKQERKPHIPPYTSLG